MLKCMACSRIVKTPYQCKLCETLICRDCRTKNENDKRYQYCQACADSNESAKETMIEKSKASDLFVEADHFT